MKTVFIGFAVLVGIASGLQAGSNNTLQKALASPWWTIAIVSWTTAAASLGMALASGERLPSEQAILHVPWYGWIGGLLGLVFVLGTVFASPKLGAGVFVALIVSLSTVTSLVLDNYGLMNFEQHELGLGRLIGALLMMAGIVLVACF